MSIFVVSAPSGTGKTTLNRRLVKEFPQVMMSVSHTTRKPRVGEDDGVHYHFIQESQFQEMVKRHAFVEWADVHSNLYGTSFEELKRIEQLGKTPLLEIDVQGWKKAQSLLPGATSIFILPPSMESLWHRLEGRGSDSLETRWLRLKNAHQEIKSADNYKYFIINRDLDEAYAELKSIVVGDTPKESNTAEGLKMCDLLNKEYERADWIQELRTKLG